MSKEKNTLTFQTTINLHMLKGFRLSFNFFPPEYSIIASSEVNTILHLSPSACSIARRNTFIAH